MGAGTVRTAFRTKRTAAVAAVALIAVGMLGGGCQTVADVEPAIVVDDGGGVTGAVVPPGGRMIMR